MLELRESYLFAVDKTNPVNKLNKPFVVNVSRKYNEDFVPAPYESLSQYNKRRINK